MVAFGDGDVDLGPVWENWLLFPILMSLMSADAASRNSIITATATGLIPSRISSMVFPFADLKALLPITSTPQMTNL